MPTAFVGLEPAERPSARAYAEAIGTIRDRLRDDTVRAICIHAGAKNATLTPFAISRKMGWSTGPNKPQFRLSYGTLGRWIAEQTGIERLVARFTDHGKVVRIFAIAEEASPPLRWRLYPEFVEGLRKAGMIGKSISQSRNAAKQSDVSGEPNGREFRAHYRGERIYRNAMVGELVKSQSDYRCSACGLRFEEMYGDVGVNYIEAHHVLPTSERKDKAWWVNPEHLVALCSNCHRMVHRLLGRERATSIADGLQRVKALRSRVVRRRRSAVPVS